MWCELSGGGVNPLPAAVAELRGVAVPCSVQAAPAGKSAGRGKKKAAVVEEAEEAGSD